MEEEIKKSFKILSDDEIMKENRKFKSMNFVLIKQLKKMIKKMIKKNTFHNMKS